MSSKFEYTDEMVARMNEICASGVTEEAINTIMEEFQYPRRSVAAKLRSEGYDTPKKTPEAPKFTEEQTEALKTLLEENHGELTAEEIATQHFPDFTARQITGKALSLDLTDAIKKAPKKVAPKTYTEEEEATIRSMQGEGAFIEDIADKLGKSVNSVRGKLLSMDLKAPQRDKKDAKRDPYEGIDGMTDNTVEELAEAFGKTPRGVKTVLARRRLACKDYTPSTVEAE